MTCQYAYSNKTANYSRICRLLIDVGTHVLREVFDGQVPTGELKQFLLDNKSKLRKVSSVTKWHLERLYPQNGELRSSDLDLSNLYILLRTACNVQAPTKGWGRIPDPSDSSKGAYIERLRQFRNDIGHANSAEMENETFEEKWRQIEEVLLFLGGQKFKDQIEKLYSSSLEPCSNNTYVDCLKTQSDSDKRSWSHADNLKSQRGRITEAHRKDDEVFVETRAAKLAETELFVHGKVQIIGNPGEGKTSVAWHLVLQSIALGYELVIVQNAKQWQAQWNPNSRQVFLADDCFGVTHLVPDLAFGWDKLQQDLRDCIKMEDTLVISTVRRHVYKSIKKLGLKPDLLGKAIDLSCPVVSLTLKERSDIIRRHAKYARLSLDEKLIKGIVEDSSPRFPLSCRLFVLEPRFQKKGADFFRNPTFQLHKELSQLRVNDPVSFSALVLLMASDGQVKFNQTGIKEDIKPKFDLCSELRTVLCINQRKCEASDYKLYSAVVKTCKPPSGTNQEDLLVALHSLTNTYVQLDEASMCYTFIHDSLLETVGLIVGSHDPNFVLSYCSPAFIQQRVRAEWSAQEFSIDDGIVPVPFVCYKAFADRFLRDIQTGHCDTVFQNPSINVEAFVGVFANVIDNLGDIALKKLMNCSDSSGHSAMYWAARAGCFVLLDFILHRCAPTPDAIHGACFGQHLNCVKSLIENEADVSVVAGDGQTPLHVICGNQTHGGDTANICKVLLAAGANINRQHHRLGSPLHIACWNQNADLVEFLLQNGAHADVTVSAGWPSLHFANNADLIRKLLLSNGVRQPSTNTQWTALHLAASTGNVEIARLLLEAGANINLQTSSGWTPLMCAAKKGHYDVVKLLLKFTTNPDIPDDFRATPLHISITYRTDKITEELLKFGASANYQSAAGYSPLHCACESGSNNIVQKLIEHGADVNLISMGNMTPLNLAEKHGDEEMIRILLQGQKERSNS